MRTRRVKFTFQVQELDLDEEIALGNEPISESDFSLSFPFSYKSLEGSISIRLEVKRVDTPFFGGFVANALGVIIEGTNDKIAGDWDFMDVARQLAINYVEKLELYLQTQIGFYWVTFGNPRELSLGEFLMRTEATWVNELDQIETFDYISSLRMRASGDERFTDSPRPKKLVEHLESRPFLNKENWRGAYLYFSEEKFLPDLATTLLQSAYRNFDAENYRLAAIEAITAVETKLIPFVENRCMERGISRKKFEDATANVFVAAHLKLLFPLALKENEFEDWIAARTSGDKDITSENILKDVLRLNSLRNNIVHEGKFEHKDIDSVLKGISATGWLLGFLSETPRNA